MATVRNNRRQEQADSEKVYRITDPSNVMRESIAALICFALAVIFLRLAFLHGVLILWIFVVFFAYLAISMAFTVKAENQGILIDLRNDTLEFAGGGFKANDVADYFRIGYHLQSFRRHKVSLSDIRQIKCYEKRSRRMKDGRIYVTVKPYLAMNGSFGAVNLTFRNVEKRDEVYFILREVTP